MTLPASGAISMSQVNVELQRSATAALSLNDPDVRILAQKPSGAISMSDLYGKTWLTAADAAAWYSNNRATTHQWCQGGSGDVRYIGGPYARYVTSSSWTMTASFTGVTSQWTTIILIALENGVNNISYSINSGSLVPADDAYLFQTSSGGNFYMRVLHINTDIKNVTSVAMTWGLNSSNNGSWSSAAVIPGKWSASAVTGTQSLAANQILVGGGTADIGDGPGTTLTGTDSMPYHYFDAWWYNNGQHWSLTNTTGSTRTATFSTGESFSAKLTFVQA
jgi:hypothetical protein